MQIKRTWDNGPLKKSELVAMAVLMALFFIFSPNQRAYSQAAKPDAEKKNVVVNNKKAPLLPPGSLLFREDLAIESGGADKEPLFVNAASVTADDDGNIYVMDQRGSRIVVFDKSGTYKLSIGKKGQGPGEIQFPRGIEISEGNNLVVYDLANRRLLTYTLTGKLLRENNLGQLPFILRIRPDMQGNYVASHVIYDGNKTVYRLTKYDKDFEALHTIINLEKISVDPTELEMYPPGLYYAVRRDNGVMWANWHEYRFEIVDESGQAVKRITKEFDPVEMTAEARRREIERDYGDRGVPAGRKLVFPKQYPAMERFLTDDEDRIIVRTYKRDDQGRAYHDVFDAAGRYLTAFVFNEWIYCWKKNKFYTIEDDKEGFQVVKRYDVVWRIP